MSTIDKQPMRLMFLLFVFSSNVAVAQEAKSPHLPGDPGGFNIKVQEYAEAVRQIANSEDVPLIAQL